MSESLYISSKVVCENEGCAMASQCSRFANYLEAKKTDMVLQVLNTSLLGMSDDGCQYLHIAKEVKAARGFKAMYATVPHGVAKNVWQDFPGRISRRQFYRLMNGEIALLPEDQTDILAYFESLGADTAVGFDIYEMVTV